MSPFDLEKWLGAHSVKVERVGSELVFSHANGETSILLLRDGATIEGTDGGVGPIASFYSSYDGASLGDSQLTFATTISGGVEISHGFRLLDFEQMASQARALGVEVGPSERVFLAEAAWMFIYTVKDEGGREVLRKYDRDFGTSRLVGGLSEILEGWWSIVTN